MSDPRVFLAASLAPAAPVVLLLLWSLAVGQAPGWWGFATFLVPSYVAMLAVGIPLFVVFQRKGWAFDYWRCIGAGAVSGVLSVSPLVALDLLSGANPFAAKMNWALFLAGTAAGAGAIAGLVFRLIAGSDITATWPLNKAK